MTRQAISTENYQSLLQRKTTAEKTAKSFPGGLEYYNQIQLAYNNSDWQWLSLMQWSSYSKRRLRAEKHT